MGLNRIIPTSIILEVLMITTQVSSLYFDHCEYNDASSHNALVAFMVNFFTTTVALFLLLSIMWIYYFKMHNYEYSNKIRKMRGFQGLILILIGGLSLGTAHSVGDGQVTETGEHCATLFEINIVAGATAIIDGTLYFLAPVRKGVSIFSRSSRPVTAFPAPPNRSEIYVIQNDLPPYEAPPSYFELNFDQQTGPPNPTTQGNPNPVPT